MSKGEITSGAGEQKLSRASVARFSLYLRHLQRFQSEGTGTVSSSILGRALGINDAQVRKDLANLGSLGHPGIGYPTQGLIAALREKLGLDREWNTIVVGVGNLARALLRYRGFRDHGFRIVGLFDSNPAVIGSTLEGLAVLSTDELPEVINKKKAELALLTVPSTAAQSVADDLVSAGIRGIMNFAPVILRLPPGVSQVTVDLAAQLEQLAFLVHLSAGT